jgi:protein phosphatase
MGTTLIVAFWHERGVSYGHIGDSRLYLLRNGALAQLTRDHTIVQEQLERGAIDREQARRAPNRNVLTRAVGIDRNTEPDVSTQSLRSGDVCLLCSDGLTDMVTDEEIRGTLLACGAQLDFAAQQLVECANAGGGLDNISVILARWAGDPERCA